MISGRSGGAAAIERYAGGGGASGQLLVEDVEDSCTGAALVALGAGAIHPAGTAGFAGAAAAAPPPPPRLQLALAHAESDDDVVQVARLKPGFMTRHKPLVS